jgi:hypothetical protein
MPITRIVVAHRPALIRRARHVYEIGNRKIVARSAAHQRPALQPTVSAE